MERPLRDPSPASATELKDALSDSDAVPAARTEKQKPVKVVGAAAGATNHM